MDNEKKYTERDLILAKREAFDVGVSAVWSRFNLGEFASGRGWEGTEELAARRYPLPKVTRPRTKGDPHGQPMVYARIGNRIQQRATCGAAMRYGWQDLPPGTAWTVERLAIWAELAANPTEEVEQSDV